MQESSKGGSSMIHLVILTTSVRQSDDVGASNAIKMAAFVNKWEKHLWHKDERSQLQFWQ